MRVRTAGGGRGALGHTPLERRVELNKRYKEKVEKLWAAGCWERPSPRLRPSPAGGRTGRCSAGTHVFDGHAAWLRGSVSTPEELEKLLDRIDRMALRSFVLRIPGQSPDCGGYDGGRRDRRKMKRRNWISAALKSGPCIFFLEAGGQGGCTSAWPAAGGGTNAAPG